jgi:hypothetical protein
MLPLGFIQQGDDEMQLTIHNLATNEITQITGEPSSLLRVCNSYDVSYDDLTKCHLTIQYGNTVGGKIAGAYSAYATVSDSISTSFVEFCRAYKIEIR